MAAEYNIEKENHSATRSLSETLTLQLEQGHANLATKTNELSEEKEKHAIARNELVKEKENLVKLTDDLNEAREKNHDIIKQLDTEKALSNSENSELKSNLRDMAMMLRNYCTIFAIYDMCRSERAQYKELTAKVAKKP